jgi:hypothetical protein
MFLIDPALRADNIYRYPNVKRELGARRTEWGVCRERLLDEIRSGSVVKPAFGGESGGFGISEFATY